MFTHKLKTLALAASLFALPVTEALAIGPVKKVRVDQENLARLCPEDQQRVLAIADRLETIMDMDRSALTSEQRKALRQETRDLRREATAFNQGGSTVIYISTAGLIIILLIILILT